MFVSITENISPGKSPDCTVWTIGIIKPTQFHNFPRFKRTTFRTTFLDPYDQNSRIYNLPNMSESVGNEESYVTKEEQVPVQDDDDVVEGGVDEATADSDAQLGKSTP